jgi:hypothetical protein
MADAKAVLKEAIDEMALLARSEGSLEQLQALAALAHLAFYSETGVAPDDDVRSGGLHETGLRHLGLI